MPVTFDGTALTITLAAGPGGLQTIDAQNDLYEPWKDWLLANPANRGFPYAFRTIGGDDLTPGITAGAYFFLQNDRGWRIKFPESDEEVTLVGNLAPEDSSLDVFSPADGNFKSVLLGLQPITQNVDALLTASQDADYNGEVFIDTFSGTTGTAHPIGTPAEPVSNMSDAMSIAARLGVRALRLIGVIQLQETMQFWTIHGQGGVAEVDINGQDVSGTEFHACGISGTLPTLSVRCVIMEGRISPVGLFNFKGALANCVFSGSLSLQAGETIIAKCASAFPGITRPNIDFAGNDIQLSLRGWLGGVEIRNITHANTVASVDMETGALRLAASCTEGLVVARGITDFEDLSAGSVVITTGMLDTQTIRDFGYFGAVYINTDTGVAGTAFPLGMADNPVNNFDDAWTIAERVGVHQFHIVGEVTLTKTVRFAMITGHYGATKIDVGGKDISGTLFEGVSLEGAIPTLTHGIVLKDSIVDGAGLTGFKGEALNTVLEANISLQAGLHLFKNCASHVPGNTRPTMDCQGNDVNISVRGWHGGLELINYSNALSTASFDFDAGAFRMLSSVSAGEIVVRGIMDLDDQSSGATIIQSGVIETKRSHLADQTIAGRAVVSLDDLTVTIYDIDDVTILKVLNISADSRTRTPV